MQFGHGLQALESAIRAKDNNAAYANMSRDRFAEGVADPSLRRCLKDFIQVNGGVNLVETRQKAVAWTAEGDTEGEVGMQQRQQLQAGPTEDMQTQLAGMMEAIQFAVVPLRFVCRRR